MAVTVNHRLRIRWVEVLAAVLCLLIAAGVVYGGDDPIGAAASDTVGAGVDTSCGNADSILIIQAGPRDRFLRTIAIRKKAFERIGPTRHHYWDDTVDCETYDTLVSILVRFIPERSLADTLDWGSLDFLASSDGKQVARYMTGKQDSIRLLDRLIEAVKRMDEENLLLLNLIEDRGEINKGL